MTATLISHIRCCGVVKHNMTNSAFACAPGVESASVRGEGQQVQLGRADGARALEGDTTAAVRGVRTPWPLVAHALATLRQPRLVQCALHKAQWPISSPLTRLC